MLNYVYLLRLKNNSYKITLNYSEYSQKKKTWPPNPSGKSLKFTYGVHEDTHVAASPEHNDVVVISQARRVTHPEEEQHELQSPI